MLPEKGACWGPLRRGCVKMAQHLNVDFWSQEANLELVLKAKKEFHVRNSDSIISTYNLPNRPFNSNFNYKFNIQKLISKES
jgi:hypothetical protein